MEVNAAHVSETIRSWLVAVDAMGIARLPLRLPYQTALRLLPRFFARYPFVEAVYLRGGMTKKDWVPGASDIDLCVVMTKHPPRLQYELLSHFYRELRWLRRAIPFLGEAGIYTSSELRRHFRWTPVQSRESRRWKSLLGSPPPEPKEGADFRAAALTEAIASYAAMWKIYVDKGGVSSRYRSRNFIKFFADVLRHSDAAASGEFRDYETRLGHLRHLSGFGPARDAMRIAGSGYRCNSPHFAGRALETALKRIHVASAGIATGSPRARGGHSSPSLERIDLSLRAALGNAYELVDSRDSLFVVFSEAMLSTEGWPHRLERALPDGTNPLPLTERLFAFARRGRMYQRFSSSGEMGPDNLSWVKARLSALPPVVRERLASPGPESSTDFSCDYLPRLLAALHLKKPNPSPAETSRFLRGCFPEIARAIDELRADPIEFKRKEFLLAMSILERARKESARRSRPARAVESR